MNGSGISAEVEQCAFYTVALTLGIAEHHCLTRAGSHGSNQEETVIGIAEAGGVQSHAVDINDVLEVLAVLFHFLKLLFITLL